MIDMKDCPRDEAWWLWDAQGNGQKIESELELTYARMAIAEKGLEGYKLTRTEDGSGDVYQINGYGVVADWPDDLFGNTERMASRIVMTATRRYLDESGGNNEE